MDHAELKRLQTKERELGQRISSAEREQAEAKARAQRDKAELEATRRKIRELSARDGPLVVSEHAILRYLERVKGLDIEAVKAEIVPPGTEDLVRKLEGVDGLYPAGEHKIRVKENTVVTVVTKDEAREEQERDRRRRGRPWTELDPDGARPGREPEAGAAK